MPTAIGWCGNWIMPRHNQRKSSCAGRTGEVRHGSEPSAFPVSAGRRTWPGLSAGSRPVDRRAHWQLG